MEILNAPLRALFDLILAPFSRVSPMISLVLISLVTAIFMLVVFKHTSNQDKLAEVKKRIHACLFEIRLFNDDLGAILRSQTEILRTNLSYLRLSLVPMIWILPPLVLIIAQLQFHYGYTGLEAHGKDVLVTARIAEGELAGGRPDVELQAPDGVQVVTPGLWVPSLSEVSWRIAPQEPGEYELTLSLGNDTVTKSIQVSEDLLRRSPMRVAPGFLDQLLYPAEKPLPADGPFRTITVDYPDAEVNLLGWRTHWMVAFFILSIVFAFMLRNRMGVTI
jgi:uncharacterized membrane protein (DUF106 family)